MAVAGIAMEFSCGWFWSINESRHRWSGENLGLYLWTESWFVASEAMEIPFQFVLLVWYEFRMLSVCLQVEKIRGEFPKSQECYGKI